MSDTPTFQDLLADFADEVFVGRNEQLSLFEKALTATRPPFLVLAVSGQGGVGKSTLLGRFRTIADDNLVFTTLANQDQTDVASTLAQLARELEQRGASFKTFQERYRKFLELKEAVEADPNVPKGILDIMLRSATRIGLRSLRHIPIAGDAAEVLLPANAEEKIVDEMSGLAAYVMQKFTNQDERVLLLETNQELSRYFLTDLNKLAENRRIILFFDTYEKTAPFLDRWLRDLITGKFGRFSGKVLFVIAGRFPLDQAWMDFKGAVRQIELQKFTEAEAREYLERSGIVDEHTIIQFLQLSDGLPILLALLVSTPGDIPTDMSSNAVERFLQGTTPDQRNAALLASVPRMFNLDVLGVLLGSEVGMLAFQWLSNAHFVRASTDGWAYHEIVRTNLLRHFHLRSRNQYIEIHNKLITYYQTLQQMLVVPEDKQYANKTWRKYEMECLYHLLSQNSDKGLEAVFRGLLRSLKSGLIGLADASWENSISEFSEVLSQVAEETGDSTLNIWSNRLKSLVRDSVSSEGRHTDVEFFALLANFESLDSSSKAIAFLCCGISISKDTIPQWQRALDYLTKAIELQPMDYYNYYWRGQVHHYLQNNQAALDDITRAIELEPDHEYIYYWRGHILYIMSKYEAALEDFNRAIELQPDDWFNQNGRGRVHHGLQNYEAALKDFTRAIELQPDNGDNYYWRGRTYYELYNYNSALKDLNYAIDLQPDDAYNYYWRGNTFYLLDDYENALKDHILTIELQPDNASNYHSRSHVYHNLHNNQAALDDITRAIELEPDKAHHYRCRGQMYYQSHDYESALKDLTRAIELQPDDASAYHSRSHVHHELHNNQAALHDITRAIEIQPDHDHNYHFRGYVLYMITNYAVALEDFTRAIELQPDDGDNYYWRGRAYYELRDYEASLKDFTRAIELQPDDGYNFARRAKVYIHLNHFLEAHIDLVRAMELLNQDSSLAFIIAEGYALMNEAKEACDMLHIASKDDITFIKKLSMNTCFDSIRETDEFKAFLTNINEQKAY